MVAAAHHAGTRILRLGGSQTIGNLKETCGYAVPTHPEIPHGRGCSGMRGRSVSDIGRGTRAVPLAGLRATTANLRVDPVKQ